ncbi:L-asparaginase isoform X2 [Aphidius gifuensis]|nr:L-asparaginase isoform X2 [Aphidius gifuensis]
MVRNESGALAPIPNKFVHAVKKYPNMYDAEYIFKKIGASETVLALPISASHRRIVYEIQEYNPLLDSSNMKMDDWIKIATDIKNHYERFDGFVVLHGTDTLSYTASALSFMLEALGKTVVITGSQLPIFDTRSDGLNNFLASLIIAGNYNIPEVCVFFGRKLMRGNRATKVASASFEAFDSPNSSPLAVAGIKIDVDYPSIFRATALEKFHVHTTLSKNVGLLKIFPSISTELVKAFLQPPMEGVILQSYGAGNIPDNRDDILDVLRAATDRGVIIVNTSQCTRDGVTDLYQAGKVLIEAGVTPGYDMTPEAALTKLAYVLSKNEYDIKAKRKIIETNLRGELTVCNDIDFKNRGQFLQSVGLNRNMEFHQLAPLIFPTMLMEAVIAKDISKIEFLVNNRADVSMPNPENRTALHLACAIGDVGVVKSLLKMGANVHIKDRYNATPLTEAIDAHSNEIIKLLVQCGAHLHEDPAIIGEKIYLASVISDIDRLEAFKLAGADLNQTIIISGSSTNILEQAYLHNRSDVINYLKGNEITNGKI